MSKSSLSNKVVLLEGKIMYVCVHTHTHIKCFLRGQFLNFASKTNLISLNTEYDHIISIQT